MSAAARRRTPARLRITLKIKEFSPTQRLAWGDALGTRVYTLAETGPGQTRFEMSERIGGPVFPLFASKIPSFDASFAQFAADLKAAAEAARCSRRPQWRWASL